jgi:hypothetical protein
MADIKVNFSISTKDAKTLKDYEEIFATYFHETAAFPVLHRPLLKATSLIKRDTDIMEELTLLATLLTDKPTSPGEEYLKLIMSKCPYIEPLIRLAPKMHPRAIAALVKRAYRCQEDMELLLNPKNLKFATHFPLDFFLLKGTPRFLVLVPQTRRMFVIMAANLFSRPTLNIYIPMLLAAYTQNPPRMAMEFCYSLNHFGVTFKTRRAYNRCARLVRGNIPAAQILEDMFVPPVPLN